LKHQDHARIANKPKAYYYVHAEDYFQQGLTLARQMGHRERTCVLLSDLGTLAQDQEDYKRAKDYFQQGLEVARQMGHHERINHLLAHLKALP